MADKTYNGAFTGAQIDEAVGKALNGTLMNAETYDPQGKATDIFKYVDEHAPSGGSGVHIGPEPPTNGETVWIDTDKNSVKYLNPSTGEWETASAPMEVKGMTMDLLWTNPDPTVEFPPQDIAVNTSGYDMLIVSFAGHSNTFGNTTGTDVVFTKVGQYKQCIFQNSAYIYFRGVGWVSYSTFIVEDCKVIQTYGNASSRTNDNNSTIPYKIYGIKNTPVTYPEGGGTTESITHPGCFYRMVNGVQEWLNPPMELGVEYKTTERYLGKPVYTKLIHFGTLPNNTYKDVEHGAANVAYIISCASVLYDGAGNGNTIPFRQNSITGNAIEVFSTTTKIRAVTNYEVNQLNLLDCHIKYTKTTD